MAAYQYNPYPVNPRNSNNDNDQVAIFIDWDNLVISNYADRGSNRPDLEVLIRRAQQYGTVVIARAYAEWNVTADRLEVYKAGIEPIYAPVFHADRDLSGQTTRGKSLADPVMVTDCIDFLHLLPQIGTYVLVTGDKDMVPVVRLARLRGRRVVIIGPDYVANVLQQVSDEFIPYRFLLAQVVTDPYAAYYQQQAQAAGQPYFPGQIPPGYQPPAGFTPQVAQPAQPQTAQANSNDRRSNRRLTGNRRNQTSYTAPTPQPYARITPPPPGATPTIPVAAPYGYYAQPGQVAPVYPQPGQVPPGYPQPELYQQAAAAQPTYGYPQPQPAYQPPTPAPTQPIVTPAPAQAIPSTYQPVETPKAAAAVVPTPATTPTPAAATPVETASADTATQAPSGQNGKTATSDFGEVKDAIQVILAQRTATGRSQMRARDLKEELLRRIPNFSERRYGFSKFKALLNAAEAAGVLQIDQSGHILWVSQPGTPKMQFGLPSEETAATADTDFEEEGDEDATNPAAEAELAAQPEAAEAAPDAFKTASPEATVEPQEAATYAAPAAEEAGQATMEEPRLEVIVPEERTTSLVPSAAPEAAAPARTEVIRPESVLGPRPSVLNQPFYEDAIVLIDHLRTRNRWLGYELLLSNVRDLLSREMPESEAKIQAGNILSKLLSDGIIKMAIEVHSRGARKMTVKVAHLQDENLAVRYALENHKLQSAAPASAEEAPAEATEAPGGSVEAQTTLQEASREAAAPVEGATEATGSDEQAGQWGSHFTQQAHPAGDADQSEAPSVEAGGEAGDLGQEAAAVAPEEMPQPATEEQPAEQSEGQSQEAQGELTGQSVDAPVVEEPGAAAETGEQVQGEADQAPQGEEPAPAGGYINTSELAGEASSDQGETGQFGGATFEENPPAGQPSQEGQPEGEGQASFETQPQAAEGNDQPTRDGEFQPTLFESQPQEVQGDNQPSSQEPQGESAFEAAPSYEGEAQVQPEVFQSGDQSNGQPEGYQPSFDGQPTGDQAQPDQDGKQVPAEVLQPVLELDGEESDDVEDGEVVAGEEDGEADGQAPKPARRPRRRRTPRPASPAEGPSESMGQPRVRISPKLRPHRRPRAR